MANRAVLLGNVGKDPEVKNLESGTSVATVSLATSEKYKNKQGEVIQDTQWHNLVFWGKSAEVVGQYVKKGMKLFVEGKIVYRSHGDGDQKRYYTDIRVDRFEMLGGDRNQSEATAQDASATASSSEERDDLPF